MAEIKYTKEQVMELLKNTYIKSCTNKNISFTKEFKIELLKQSDKWVFYKDIFKNFWFPDYIVNSEIPRNSLNRWKKNINTKWIIEENKWRKKKENTDFQNMNSEEKVKFLEAKVAYLEEVNEFFKDWIP